MIGGVERLIFDVISFFDKEKFYVEIITVLGSGPLEASFRDSGIPIYFAGISGPFSKKLPFKLYWLLIAPITLIRITFFLIKSKPDVVISSLHQADILGMIASKVSGVKKRIIIQHDIVKFKRLIYLFKKIFALNLSTQIISVSNTVKDFLIKYFEVKNEKITTIYDGIDYERFKKGKKIIFNPDSPVIGIIGRLEEIKGHIYVLEALKILKEEHGLYTTLLLAGEGSLRDDLEKYVVKNNPGSVKFLGNVSDVPDFLTKIDILIVPSISEGFGLVVLEGMVSGKVVIASDIEVMNELIKNGENGLLFKSKNSDSLVMVLLKVLNNKDFCKKLKENANLFSEKNKQLFNIYEVSNTYQELLISKN